MAGLAACTPPKAAELHVSLASPEGQAIVAAAVRRYRADAVLFDSLTIGAQDAALSDPGAWNQVLAGIEAWGVPVMCIDHLGNDAARGRSTPYAQTSQPTPRGDAVVTSTRQNSGSATGGGPSAADACPPAAGWPGMVLPSLLEARARTPEAASVGAPRPRRKRSCDSARGRPRRWLLAGRMGDRLLEAAEAERYPTIRWHFPWQGYVVAGLPDGLTDDLVYEFKTTRSGRLLTFTKPVGMAQADLYGYFFRRPRKRVQYLLIEEGTTLTWHKDVDRTYAEDLLARFAAIDTGAPPPPPRPWKCRSCKFRQGCPICPLDRRTDR